MSYYHPFGGHLANPDDPAEIDIEQYRDVFGDNGCATVLHLQKAVLPRLRERCPDALILVRCYLPNWAVVSPESWAVECASIYRWCQPYTQHITWANEQDLAAESGGAVGATAERPISVTDYGRIDWFNRKFVAHFRRQPGTGNAILHYPALSGGHQADDGLVGYEILRPGIDLCPVLDVHLYPSIDRPVTDPWEGAARIDRVLSLFPGKPLFLSEVGNFAVTDHRAAEHLVQCGYYWQSKPDILGFTYFILANPTKAEGNAPNDLSRNPLVLDALRRASRVMRPDRDPLPRNEHTSVPTTAPTGYDKAEPLIGAFRELEIYHQNDSDLKTSMAIGDRGYLTWRARTNETIVACDNGELWRDLGNRGDGVLRKVV